MPLKIAMIGAGSIGFTRRLMHDILAVPEFTDTTFAFMDIDPVNLDMITQLKPARYQGQWPAGKNYQHP